MSRNVNWNDPTRADLRWAVEWERWHDIRQAGLDPDEVREMFELKPHPDGGKFFNTAGVPGDDFAKRFNPETGRVESIIPDGSNGQNGLDPDDEDDDELPPYEDWKGDDLKAELAARGLATSGKKEDLVHRLEIDDQAKATQEPDDE